MREFKIIIAAAIFLLLTAVKLCAPAAVAAMREGIVREIDRSIDYEAVVTELSRQVETHSKYLSEEWPVSATAETAAPMEESPLPTPIPTPSQTPIPTAASKESLLPFEWTMPLETIAVSSGFGSRTHPIEGTEKFHYGLDISATHGDEIGAFAAGKVETAQYSESYGNYVVIRHDDTYSSLYAHCSKLLVSVGEEVGVGQPIALVGDTGLATGPHLHFELKRNGECIDPGEFLC